MLLTATSACSLRVHAVEDDAVQADVERLLDDPLRLIGFGREAREQRDIRLQIALLA